MSTSTAVIGRDAELAELAALIGPRRLVSIVGTGGVGKTTLARSWASDGRARGRVAWVDLTAVEDPSGVEPAIAAAIGLPRFDVIGASTVADDLAVVIDNCEHVLPAAATAVVELRTALPEVPLCVTSRIPLGLRDEHVVRVAPLPVPPVEPDGRVPVTRDAPAVQMFLAVSERVGGLVADADLGDVGELCRRVDGVPLAIEIIATRTRSMSVREIIDRLGDRLDRVDRAGARDEPRHRSVRETVEWSYQLLDADTARLFDSIGVISGGFDISTACALAAEADPSGTIDRLDELVASSLLVASRGPDGSTWYHQLDAVRACARDHVRAAGAWDAWTDRLVDHLVSEARAIARHAADGWQVQTFVRIDSLLDSLLSAVRWTVERDETPERAFTLVALLWGQQSRTDDVLAVGELALKRWPDPTTPGWGNAAATVATCRYTLGRRDDADRLISEALAADTGSPFAEVVLRRVRGQIAADEQRYDDASEWLTAAAGHARRSRLGALVADAELLRSAAAAGAGDASTALAIARAVRAEAGDRGVTTTLAAWVESDVLLALDPSEALVVATQGRDLAAKIRYGAASVALGRTVALARMLLDDVTGAADDLRAVIAAMMSDPMPSQYRAVLEAAAAVAHRAGRGEWSELARAARAVPAMGNRILLTSARLIPDPAAAGEPALGLSEAAALADRVLAEIGAAHPTRPTLDGLPVSEAAVANRWVRRDDFWEIEFDGQAVLVRHRKGFEDLAALLSSPGTERAAIDLVGAAVSEGDVGEVLDRTARRQYEQRIRDLQADLVDAEDHHDIGRVDRLTEELDALVDQLAGAVGLGHRSRRTGGTTERARTAVTRRIRLAIAHVLDVHPTAGRHLDASVRTGTFCVYQPERPTEWAVRS